ncbi:MAG TPA: nuclear transport factor 2 family protein [Acidimicrobiales bacterium]|nr:nuclear transport factor 2 family protein [Acidimicrobiales bacterium]
MAGRDWDGYARTLEAALDMSTKGGFRELFAPGATFADPANAPTDDLRDIQRQTRAVMPDWRQEITSIRGGEDWAVFEWIGRATYRSRDGGGLGNGTPITMHGATIIEVDSDGLITSWRDYLDRKEPEDQIRAALRRDRGDQ